jgi:hypothetical protein
VSEEAIERFLGLSERGHAGEEELADAAAAGARAEAERVAKRVAGLPRLPAEQADALLGRVHARQRAVGYGGDYRAWIEKVTPPDFE